jgi:hypothetical protein
VNDNEKALKASSLLKNNIKASVSVDDNATVCG